MSAVIIIYKEGKRSASAEIWFNGNGVRISVQKAKTLVKGLQPSTETTDSLYFELK